MTQPVIDMWSPVVPSREIMEHMAVLYAGRSPRRVQRALAAARDSREVVVRERGEVDGDRIKNSRGPEIRSPRRK